MNLLMASSKILTPQSFQSILEFLANGQVAAWLPEFPNSKVLAVDSSDYVKGDHQVTESYQKWLKSANWVRSHLLYIKSI
jgi:hypothetical protein